MVEQASLLPISKGQSRNLWRLVGGAGVELSAGKQLARLLLFGPNSIEITVVL